MSQIATTIEQSRRLIEAGLNPESADMYWGHVDFGGCLQITVLPAHPQLDINSTISPAWSLSRLIDIRAEMGSPFNYGPMANGSAAVIECLVDSIVDLLKYRRQNSHARDQV